MKGIMQKGLDPQFFTKLRELSEDKKSIFSFLVWFDDNYPDKNFFSLSDSDRKVVYKEWRKSL